MQVNSMEWIQISAGYSHTCGINKDKYLYCWGALVGDGTEFPKTTPTKIGTDKWLNFSAGNYHKCGIKEDNFLYCWGENTEGHLGIGTSGINEKKNEPTKVGTDEWLEVECGSSHTCGIKKSDNKLYCWGYNRTGQLGIGSLENKNIPTKVSDEVWYDFNVGREHSCGLNSSKSLYCWGRNDYGQLGDGTGGEEIGNSENNKSVPTLIDSNSWTIFTLGGYHTCSQKEGEKELYCWGNNDSGQVGTGTCDSLNRASPVRVEFTY